MGPVRLRYVIEELGQGGEGRQRDGLLMKDVKLHKNGRKQARRRQTHAEHCGDGEGVCGLACPGEGVEGGGREGVEDGELHLLGKTGPGEAVHRSVLRDVYWGTMAGYIYQRWKRDEDSVESCTPTKTAPFRSPRPRARLPSQIDLSPHNSESNRDRAPFLRLGHGCPLWPSPFLPSLSRNAVCPASPHPLLLRTSLTVRTR